MLNALQHRHSYPLVTSSAPSRDELERLVRVAAGVADHGALKPWRLIALRGAALERLGAAFVAATGVTGPAAARLAAKPLRASLLITIVAVTLPSTKVTEWEQDAAAAGVAHALSLLLDEAGWGVMWRTGPLTRSVPVHAMHGLAENEKLLGWLYVGGRPELTAPVRRAPADLEGRLTELE